MSVNYTALGKRIRKLRIEQGLTQSGLADMIGKSHVYVSRLERGEKGCSLDTLMLIAESLHTSIDALVRDEGAVGPREGVPGFESEFAACGEYEQFVLYRSAVEIRNILREGESLRDATQYRV